MNDNILGGWSQDMTDDPVQYRESDSDVAEERRRAERTAAQMRKLGHAITYILWGYVLLHLDFNVETIWDYNYVTGETVGGALNLLPDWVGYLLILKALPAIGEEEPSATLLASLAKVLAAIAGILWVTSIFTDSPYLLVLELTELAVNMYFIYQLFTNLAAIAGKYGYPGQKKLLTLRTVNTVMGAALYIAGQLSTLWQLEVEIYGLAGIIVVASLLFLLAVGVWTGVVLWSLKKYLDRGRAQNS
ncbi:MAG: hypothetical protein LUE29_10070 [Lachnospiraceae bacterium]|nr:hypothetical protein [Lachnospiraceae bacterium]